MTKGNAHVKDVRGTGLLVGVELDIMAGPVVDAAREMGVLAITAGKGDIVRLVPPLVLSDADIDKVGRMQGEGEEQDVPVCSVTIYYALPAGCRGPWRGHCQGLCCTQGLK